MNDEWTTRTIGSFGRVVTGKTPSTREPDNFGGPYPFITIPDLDGRVFVDRSERTLSEKGKESMRNLMLPANAVMMSCIATIGKCGITTIPSFTNQQINSVICSDDVDPRYVYYCFTQLGYALEAAGGGGSVYTNVSKSRFADIEVETPPLSEQRAIAGVLGALDDKMELNRRMNETLEAIAQAEFRRMMEEGGEMKPVGEIAEINSWTLGKNDKLDRIEYIEISEVSRGNIANVQVYSRGEEPSRARRRLRHGDTVLSTVRPDRGSYFLCLHPSPNLIASTGFAVVTPTKAPWSFIHAALTQAEVSEHLGHQADGGAYPAVSPEIIGKWEVPWPDDDGELEEFHKVCAPLYERAEHNRRESQTLAGLRDALLPKLLSGELRVKN